LTEYDTFHQSPPETEDDMQSLLRGIDLQICLMRIIKGQIEACIRAEKNMSPQVHEVESRYGKSGYMADVELDDYGEIAAIRYDWVEP